MIKNKLLHTYLLLLTTCTLYSTPVVTVVFPGLLGNRLFAFCISKIVAEKLGFNLYSLPIYGFHNTYLYQYNEPSAEYPSEHIMGTGPDLKNIDIKKIISDRRPRNIRLEGYFHKYEYLKPYTEKIRNDWLKIDPNIIPKQDPNDIVLHIRTQYWPYFLPFEYYERALNSTAFNKVFICIDEPSHPFLENFKKYNPTIISSRSLNQQMSSNISWDEISKINFDDFVFISSFNKIITSQSTYAWWAAFLSNAEEIYAPYCDDDHFQVYGKVEEERYHYIDTTIGKKPS